MKNDDIIKILLDSQERNTQAFDKVSAAINTLNDQNELHVKKEDEWCSTLREVVASNKAVMTLFYLVTGAVIILAGAEKALTYVKLFNF
jgi:predicted RNA binding protein with dsRBD fold (UPF0201 family)